MGLEDFASKVEDFRESGAKAIESVVGKEQVEKMRYYAGINDGQDAVEASDASRETLAFALQVVAETGDRSLLDTYLERYSVQEGRETPKELQEEVNRIAMNLHAREVSPTDTRDKRGPSQETFSEVNRTFPFAAKENLAHYETGRIQGWYKNQAPEFLAGLPEEDLEPIYNEYPDAFAETFPGSPLVEGQALNKCVEQVVRTLPTMAAKDLKLTSCGVTSGSNLLANPNLTGTQLYKIAEALCQTKYNSSNPVGFESMDFVVSRLTLHPGLGKEAAKLLSDRFPEGTVSSLTREMLDRKVADRAA